MIVHGPRHQKHREVRSHARCDRSTAEDETPERLAIGQDAGFSQSGVVLFNALRRARSRSEVAHCPFACSAFGVRGGRVTDVPMITYREWNDLSTLVPRTAESAPGKAHRFVTPPRQQVSLGSRQFYRAQNRGTKLQARQWPLHAQENSAHTPRRIALSAPCRQSRGHGPVASAWHRRERSHSPP